MTPFDDRSYSEDPPFLLDDRYFMRIALQEAMIAAEEDEVPIGAVVVVNNKIIAKAHNSTERLSDITAHAEMLAITAAQTYLHAKTIEGCSLYVTIEPCLMCAGAIRWARPDRLIWGASEPKSGFSNFGTDLLHRVTQTTSGVLEEECQSIMKAFFQSKRR